METTSRSWNQLVFEKRNKEYGAYVIRNSYHQRVIKSLFFTMLLLLLIPLWFLIKSGKKANSIANLPMKDVFEFEMFSFNPIEVIKKSQPKIANHNPDPLSFKLVDNPKPVIDPKTDDSPFVDVPIDNTSPGTPGDQPTTQKDPGPFISKETYSIASVDTSPEFPGGIEKFYSFLKDNIRFTEMARANGISGRLYVSFIISEEGKLTEIEILRGVGAGLDEQVEQALLQSPKWSPGRFKGMNVKTRMNLPVNFSLK